MVRLIWDLLIPICAPEKIKLLSETLSKLVMLTLNTAGGEKLNVEALETVYESNDMTIDDEDTFVMNPELILQKALLSDTHNEASHADCNDFALNEYEITPR
jgi:hypothetical protein